MGLVRVLEGREEGGTTHLEDRGHELGTSVSSVGGSVLKESNGSSKGSQSNLQRVRIVQSVGEDLCREQERGRGKRKKVRNRELWPLELTFSLPSVLSSIGTHVEQQQGPPPLQVQGSPRRS